MSAFQQQAHAWFTKPEKAMNDVRILVDFATWMAGKRETPAPVWAAARRIVVRGLRGTAKAILRRPGCRCTAWHTDPDCSVHRAR